MRAVREIGAEQRGRRRRFAVAAVLMAVASPVLSGAGADRAGSAPDGTDRPAPVSEAADLTAAARTAREQGTRVEALDQRTATRTVYAEPDGTMTAEVAALPVRVPRDGGWVGVDTTVVERPDGSVGPVAAAVPMTFSGGGADQPLVRYGDAARIELSWPDGLPEPELAGDTVTYPEVMPGVDLRLRVAVDGFAQYLVVKDRSAAFVEIRLGLRTRGVAVRATESGGLVARDTDGTVVFAAPPSRMWDAADPPRQAEVGVAVEDGALVLRPDQSLFTDPRTQYPVTVDPQWHTADKQAWTSVLSGKPTTEYWNSSGDPPWAQVGQCYQAGGACNGIGEAWTYWRFDTSFLSGRMVISADLNLVTVYSPSCDVRQHRVYKSSANISSATNWNNRPGGTLVGTFDAPGVYVDCEGWKSVGISVTGSVNRGGTTTYFVRAANGGDQLAWRKYENNAKLRVNFNRAPSVPTGLTTDPPLPAPCAWCGGVRYLADDSVRLLARLSDPDGDAVRPVWRTDIDGTVGAEVRGAFKTSGSLHDRVVNTANLPGRTVVWHVKAEDSAHGGGWATGPSFAIDREPPTAPPGVSGTPYVADNRWHGGVGVPGMFTFDAAGVGDVNHFLYGWSEPPTTKVEADALGGRASVSLTPPGDGPQDLYVRSVDRAGNQGPTRVHHFYVRAGSGPLAQWSFEGNAADQAFLGDRDGVLVGDVDFVPGAVGQAVSLNGVDTRVTAPNAVRTDASFSVSAWVRLDSGGYARAAVSQDGTNFAGFDLWYRPDDGGRWVFGMARSDDSYQGTDLAVSTRPAQIGVWTHLAGVYDAGSRQLRLYVNGALSGTANRQAFDWHAAGWVQIGRTMWDGSAGVDYWPGRIDEVKLYDRVLAEGEVRASVAADGVTAAHWKLDEDAGTTGRNEVADGEMLALRDGAAFTGDEGAVGGAVRLDGVDDVAATSGPAVRTDQSYTVAAWVRLETAPSAGDTVTALSQDGAHMSGFFVGYRALATGDRWEFYLTSEDVAGAPAGAVVRSEGTAEPGSWTHLAAVYDAAAGTARLYVDGVAGEPVAVPASFDAVGPFVIGRGFNAGPSGYWHGAVDEVRVYRRALSVGEIRAVVSRDDVALGEWRLDGNLDDATGNGGDGTPQGTPDWVAGHSGSPDPTDLAARMDGDDWVSLPHTVDVTRSFSVAAWVKLDQVGGGATVLSQDGDRTSAFQVLASADGHWVLEMSATDVVGGGSVSRVVGPAAQAAVWTHLVGIYDAGAQELSLYVNGVRAGLTSHRQTWHYPAGGLQIGAGRSQGDRQNLLSGAVDDVTVYGRRLFAAEIQTMAGRDLTLAHHWRLDEGSGDTAADAVGRRPATVAGEVNRTPGRLGNAVDFDGGHLSTDGVDIRTDASFTVTAWVRLEQTCDPGTEFECRLVAVSLDGGGEDGSSKFRLGHTATQFVPGEGHWVFELPELDGTVTKAAVTVLPSEIGRWTHLAGVYDRPTGKLWLYVNGIRKGDGTLIEPWQATAGLQLGRGRDGAGGWIGSFPGGVDDVRLYSGALDDDRISNLFRSYPEQEADVELPVADAGRWTFDENTGTTADDSSGRQQPATLHGGAGWVPGRSGHAGQFDGVDDYAATAGPVLDTTGSFAVSVWAYLGATSENQVVLAQAGAQASAFYLFYDAGRGGWAAAVAAEDTAGSDLRGVHATGPAPAGRWTQLGLVYRSELDQLRLYVNGRLSGALVGVETWAATGPLTVGQGRWAGVDSFHLQGAVDDVRAFGHSLTDGEMREVYDNNHTVVTGHWRFDDDTVRDWSGRDNPTSASGAVSFMDGPSGRALRLANSSGQQVAVSAQDRGVPEHGSFTVSAWVYLTHEPAVQTVVAQDGDRMSSFVLQYRPTLNRWVFGAWNQDADGAELVYARSDVPAALGEWTHLTGVYDHAAGQLRLYANGELAGSQDGVTLWPSTGGLTIGRGKQNGAPAQFFDGVVDEVRVELGILPDDEIAQLAHLEG